ncbi:MAG: hypothetical protein UR28_C0025G0011 [Candidatus Peregrinibacteria bacterium GW2011_GWF2_33_10]|nr:MAG: hypothetical protein UR28_C0025G0011 [Candidatus Peregrinibacteria bacterium GW2011_GWF2_33_10]
MRYFYSSSRQLIKRRKPLTTASSKHNLFNPDYNHNTSKSFLKVIKLLLIIFIMSFVVYSLFFSPKFAISSIRVEKNNQLINDDLINLSLNKYKGKNIFLTKEADIRQDLEKNIKNMAFFNIQKNIPDTIEITIQEYKDVLNLIVYFEKIEKTYLINENGDITKENVTADDLPYVYLRTIQNQDKQHFALDKTEIEYLLSSKKYFEEKFNIEVKSIDYFQIEHEIHLNTVKNFSVWLDFDESYLTQLHALKLALSKLDIFNTPLLYIDLRIANGQKIIFKKR